MASTDSKKNNAAAALDSSMQAAVGKLTGGISPAALLLAFFDWYFHLRIHPAKQIELMDLAQQNYWYVVQQTLGHLSGDPTGEYSILPSFQDKRFVSKSWQAFPYSFIYESFLQWQNWWHSAATNVRGVSHHHEEVVDFTLRQILDMISPSNSVFTNPEVQQATIETRGRKFHSRVSKICLMILVVSN